MNLGAWVWEGVYYSLSGSPAGRRDAAGRDAALRRMDMEDMDFVFEGPATEPSAHHSQRVSYEDQDISLRLELERLADPISEGGTVFLPTLIDAFPPLHPVSHEARGFHFPRDSLRSRDGDPSTSPFYTQLKREWSEGCKRSARVLLMLTRALRMHAKGRFGGQHVRGYR